MAIHATIIPEPSPAAPNSVALHKRAIVTVSQGALSTFISGGLPVVSDPQDPNHRYTLTAVCLGAEAGSTDLAYVTWDGVSTPAAALGFVVPVLPSYIRIAPTSMTYVKLLSAGTTNVQCVFEFAG